MALTANLIIQAHVCKMDNVKKDIQRDIVMQLLLEVMGGPVVEGLTMEQKLKLVSMILCSINFMLFHIT